MNAKLVFDKESNTWQCVGSWSMLHLDALVDNLKEITWPTGEKLSISTQQVTALDSAGALMLTRCIRELEKAGNTCTLSHVTPSQQEMLHMVEQRKTVMERTTPERKPEPVLEQLGKETVNKLQQLNGLVILVGDLSTRLFEAFGQWHKLHTPSIVSVIDSAGLRALPIVGLLSFLIGVVLAYQMGLQLETYGANSFIAYLSGMAIFREFGPLITAILVAGRTSSSFTAQIGGMKVNEEVDAITTMGLSPTELLVLPKVLGLLLVFPLLIFWADFFSVIGAMLMSQYMLGIYPADFLFKIQDAVGFKQFMLGMYKAPTYAIIISVVGCFQGFRVEGSADSIGKQTTKSVVQALFLIIVADAAYSVIYNWMGL